MAIVHFIEIIPIAIILLLISVFWLWMLVDCILNKSLKGTPKVLWFLLILFTHIIGAILYALIGRSKKRVP
jgi:hypothetical protein